MHLFLSVDSHPSQRDSSDSDGDENHANFSPSPVCILSHALFCMKILFIYL